MNYIDLTNLINLFQLSFFLKGGINGSYEFIKGPVCKAVPAKLDCEKNLPEFWSAIATWIFNSAEGWYAPKYFCEVCRLYMYVCMYYLHYVSCKYC